MNTIVEGGVMNTIVGGGGNEHHSRGEGVMNTIVEGGGASLTFHYLARLL